MQCYCGSTKSFAACCQVFISRQAPVNTCEQLMRSRYSAYCHKEIDYIYHTYHPSVRQMNPPASLATFAHDSHFIALDVHHTEQHQATGFVEFTVQYIQQNVLYQFRERSRFVYEGRWYYLDGVLTDSAPEKIQRNDPCPCQSGKKFKQCHNHLASGGTL